MTNLYTAPIAFLLLLSTAALSPAADLHVSPAGNDGNPGTADKPLQSLAAAQKRSRAVKAHDALTIILHGGIYYLPETLVLTAEDSGTKQAPVTWRAADGESVVVSGGVKLDLTWEKYRDGILQAHVPAGLETDQLFVNGQRQILARYPNYDPAIDTFNGYAADCHQPAACGALGRSHRRLSCTPCTRPCGAISRYRITGKDANGNVTLEGGWQGNRRARSRTRNTATWRTSLKNSTHPANGFLNTRTATLYFYPPAGSIWPGRRSKRSACGT